MGKRKKRVPPELLAKWRETERRMERVIERALAEEAARAEAAGSKSQQP